MTAVPIGRMTRTSIKYLFELNALDSDKFSYFKALKKTDKKQSSS